MEGQSHPHPPRDDRPTVVTEASLVVPSMRLKGSTASSYSDFQPVSQVLESEELHG